jgi:hypothetical protein
MQDKLAPAIRVGNCNHAGHVAGAKTRVGPRQQATRPPEIHVQQRDGRIESIVITCSCGQQVTVVCDYEENSK